MNLSPGRNERVKNERTALGEWLSRAFSVSRKAKTAALKDMEETAQLLESISSIKKEWSSAVNNFEYADSQEMVDYYTYKIKAYEVMYEFLLKKAKAKGVRVDLASMPGLPCCEAPF